jgi:hypothetical protein
MIEQLEQLQPGEMLTIDNEVSKQLTGLEDFSVEGTSRFEFDGQQVIIIEMNTYNLIATDMGGDLKFAICEEYDEACGSPVSETDYLGPERKFLDEIELIGGELSVVYLMTNASSPDEEDDDAFAEYTATDYYNYLLIWRQSNCVSVYRGIMVREDALLL